MIARQRPDILNLLTKLSQSGPSGMMLDNFTFKKHQPVSIAGTAANRDQLYEFQKKLDGQKGITDVKIANEALNAKDGKIGFKMTFHYKNFTRKK